ncbi:DBH-like monooxygenase protein 2 homolog [Sinocyclocheilus anshuiensis]|nr:PREDICTED: DBH-like monooxygenase protein 2 homolog [Sinocyclocheilus anshuiensis]
MDNFVQEKLKEWNLDVLTPSFKPFEEEDNAAKDNVANGMKWDELEQNTITDRVALILSKWMAKTSMTLSTVNFEVQQTSSLVFDIVIVLYKDRQCLPYKEWPKLSHVTCNFRNLLSENIFAHHKDLGSGCTTPLASIEEFDQVCHRFEHTPSLTEVFVPSWVKWKRTEYRPGTTLLVSHSPDGEPQFGAIQKIVVFKSVIKFIVRKWDTVGFERHYFVCCVPIMFYVPTTVIDSIDVDSIDDYHPLHVVRSYKEGDSNHYVFFRTSKDHEPRLEETQSGSTSGPPVDQQRQAENQMSVEEVPTFDRHAVGKSMPVVDQQQNYKLLSLTESDGKTVMKFQRSIGSCDENDLPITNLPMKLIYAYGQNDNITYHSTRRGRKELNLLKYMPRVNPPNSSFFDITMVNFTVPAKQTHYHCKIMRAPTFDRKQHIYRIEPVITNFDLVHHLLLYRCPLTVTEPFEAECFTGVDRECMETVALWGVGGGAFEFPEVAGLPIGGNVGDFFYRLEVHYNNLNKSADRVDNTGLRFYYTSELRQHDAAVLMTGLAVAPGYAIPPKAKSFLTYGLCDTAYIPKVLETPHDLQVFSVMLHTHLAGRKVRVGHFRGGKQIDFLAVDENYDFEYQEVTNLGKTKTVKLGDKLLVECTYNTENRSTLTWGGLSTSDEMCLAFLFYYPAMNLSSCISLPNAATLISEMGANDTANWVNMMFMKTWNDMSINQYQQTLKRIDQLVVVTNSNNNGSHNKGTLPDLKVIPSAPCMSGCATKSLALLSLLLCLAVQWASL